MKPVEIREFMSVEYTIGAIQNSNISFMVEFLPCGKPASQPMADPKLVTPSKFRLSASISGPPESPLHTDCFCAPFTQITLLRNAMMGKYGKHSSSETVFKSAYCRIGARSLSPVCIKPFPIATASTLLLEVHAKLTGLMTSVTSTGDGSLIKPISLLKLVKQMN